MNAKTASAPRHPLNRPGLLLVLAAMGLVLAICGEEGGGGGGYGGGGSGQNGESGYDPSVIHGQ